MSHYNLGKTGTVAAECVRSSKIQIVRENVRLRTKFMVSLAVVIVGLTWATLFIVRRTAEGRVQREIQEESQNALVTFQVVEHGHLLALMRKADLLASLVTLRNGDPSAIEDAGKDPWQSEECDLLALAGYELKEMFESDMCCGMGGSYSVKFPEISAPILERKLGNIEKTGAGTVAMDCPGCVMQIRGLSLIHI